MPTIQLLILCATVLAIAWTVARAFQGALETRVVVAREDAARARARDAEARRASAAQGAASAPPARVGSRVTVHTKKPDDQTIFGVLVGDYADRIVLEDASYVTPHGPAPMPGTQHVATRDVAWIDVHALVTLPDHAPVAAPVPAEAS